MQLADDILDAAQARKDLRVSDEVCVIPQNDLITLDVRENAAGAAKNRPVLFLVDSGKPRRFHGLPAFRTLQLFNFRIHNQTGLCFTRRPASLLHRTRKAC